MRNSIVEQVISYADITPNKIALSDGKCNWTFMDLKREIIYAKDILTFKYNIQQGDAVVIAANKQLSFVSVYFACHLIGAVALPVAPEINNKRLSLICEKVEPKLLLGLENGPEMMLRDDLSAFISPVDYEADEEITFPRLDTLADIIFTTGTTGEPKGVQLSHNNISAAALNINTFIKNTSNDVEMLALPISHSFGLGRLRCALSNGQTVIILGSFANMKRFFRFIEEYKVTGFGMVPASWSMIKKMSGTKIEEYSDQLKYIEIGSAPMAFDEKKLLINILPNTRICMHYGLTEASRSCFMEFHESEEYLDTVGMQSPNMYVEIMDENGNILPRGEEGEICVKGDAVTMGYYKLEDVNNNSYFGQYFRTGDWGTKDLDGRIRLCSRKKELINVGGKKVSPIEVEEALVSLEYIQEAVCVGIADPNGVLGEVVKAFVVTDYPERISDDKIRADLTNAIEDYKIPFQCEVIDEIPKTSSGKIQRLSLKNRI